MKRLIVCADDYGLTAEVGEGIRRLSAAGRLSAVSCITDSPIWEEEAEGILPLQDKVSLGLHFNLTESFGEYKPDLSELIRDCLLQRLDEDWVLSELQSQLDAFENIVGRRPDFVDGHQHVHVFPGIRTVLFKTLKNRYLPIDRPWLRKINPSLMGHDAKLKALALRFLAFGFSRQASKIGFNLSGDFYGLYSLKSTVNYANFMNGWFRQADNASLLMCHPGVKAEHEVSGDSISETRCTEWEYLISHEFYELCRVNRVSPMCDFVPIGNQQ